MRVLVATIGKPFGVRGDVTLRLNTDEPDDRLAVGESLWVIVPAGDQPAEQQVTVLKSRVSPPGAVIRLSGVNDRNQAEDLRGRQLWADVDPDRQADEPEEWYDHQLVGLPCYDPQGQRVGEVVEVAHHPAHDNLVVRTEFGNRFVPFVSAIVTDVSAERVVVADPGGLLSDMPSGEVSE